jgi:hypothetical protein
LEKTNKETILEILEGCRPNKGEKEEFGIKDTVKEIVEKAKRSIVKNDPHYRMSMKKVITNKPHYWANINKPGKALLPVIGCYQNKIDRHCNLARKTMAKHTGYKFTQAIDTGLKSLMREGMIIKKKGYRTKNYYLTDKARWIDEEGKDKGTSHFRLYQKDVKYWAILTPCEKAAYPVLYVKANINYTFDNDDELWDFWSVGYIDEIQKYLDLIGIKRCAWKKVIEGLKTKKLLNIKGWPTPRGRVTYRGTYYLYPLRTMYQEKEEPPDYEE